MELWAEKLVVLVLTFTIMSIAGLLPLYMGDWYNKKGVKGTYYISLINSFGGGVFFGTYFMFMAPSARDTLVETLLVPYGISYPIPELMASLGFFLMLYIDKAVMYATKKNSSKKETNKRDESLTINSKYSAEKDDADIILNSIKYTYRQCDDSNSIPTSPKLYKKLATLSMHCDNDLNTNNHNSTAEQIRNEQIQTVSWDVEKVIAMKEKEVGVEIEVNHVDDMAARPYIFLTACSIDCLFGGMSLGLLSSPGGIWTLFIGVISHEIVVCFTFGLRLLTLFSAKKIAFIILFYAVTTPIGIIIGLATYQIVGEGDHIEILSACCEAMAGGIYIYVTFLEILNEELTHNSGISKVLAVTMGFIFMGCTVMINSLDFSPVNDVVPGNSTVAPMLVM